MIKYSVLLKRHKGKGKQKGHKISFHSVCLQLLTQSTARCATWGVFGNVDLIQPQRKDWQRVGCCHVWPRLFSWWQMIERLTGGKGEVGCNLPFPLWWAAGQYRVRCSGGKNPLTVKRRVNEKNWWIKSDGSFAFLYNQTYVLAESLPDGGLSVKK